VSKEITLLLSLQEKDRECAELAVLIGRSHAQKKQTEQRLLEEHTTLNQLRQQLLQLEHDSRLKNLEVDDLDVQIRDYKKQLDKEIISYKEMEALRTKIEHQRERISEMEDEALALMETIELTRQRLEKRAEETRTTEETLKAQCEEIDQQIAQMQVQKTHGEEERAKIASEIRPHLLSRYETLHAKYEDPVVAIIGKTCSGCNLKVSASTLERARNGAEIIQCENCSRILYFR
jgi:predicted  nucleic acid-binding Zn-ribbon protein